MTLGRTHIFAGLLLASSFCWADADGLNQLTVAEYRSELDRLLLATQQLDSSGHPVPPILQNLPLTWRVHTDQQNFEVSAEGLRKDVRSFEHESNVTTATAIRSRLQDLRSEIDGFDAAPPDVSRQREHLTAILARPEFRDVSGPSFLERLQQKLLGAILSVLAFVFGAAAIPAISQFVIYGLIALAVGALGLLAYRQIQSISRQDIPIPSALAVSAKSWHLWLQEARAAAARNDWREAIHLAYWGGISFLEQQGAWRPDRARTPREYLRLLSDASEHREPLMALTRVFELTWYAKRGADPAAFSQTMQALERLGCRPR